MAKHFLKTLLIFMGMIIVGLAVAFLVTSFDKNGELLRAVN